MVLDAVTTVAALHRRLHLRLSARILLWVLLSWFRLPYSLNPVQRFLHDVVDPYLRSGDGSSRMVGPLDLSPMAAIFALIVLRELLDTAAEPAPLGKESHVVHTCRAETCKVGRSLFGYNRAMVEQLIEEVAHSFEATWRERGELADKVEALEKQVAELQRARASAHADARRGRAGRERRARSAPGARRRRSCRGPQRGALRSCAPPRPSASG